MEGSTSALHSASVPAEDGRRGAAAAAPRPARDSGRPPARVGLDASRGEDHERDQAQGKEEHPETWVQQGRRAVAPKEKAEDDPPDDDQGQGQALPADGFERLEVERIDAHRLAKQLADHSRPGNRQEPYPSQQPEHHVASDEPDIRGPAFSGPGHSANDQESEEEAGGDCRRFVEGGNGGGTLNDARQLLVIHQDVRPKRADHDRFQACQDRPEDYDVRDDRRRGQDAAAARVGEEIRQAKLVSGCQRRQIDEQHKAERRPDRARVGDRPIEEREGPRRADVNPRTGRGRPWPPDVALPCRPPPRPGRRTGPCRSRARG